MERNIAQLVVAEPETGLLKNQVSAPAGYLKLIGEEGFDVRRQGIADGGVFSDALGGKGDMSAMGMRMLVSTWQRRSWASRMMAFAIFR